MRIKNLGLKSLSLLTAVLLFLHVHSAGNTSVISFVVPVEVRNVASEKMIIWPRNISAQVSVRGPASLVASIAGSPPVFRIELPPEIGNQYSLTLQASDLALPGAIEVLSIEPSEIELTFDNRIRKRLPVALPQIGTLSDSLRLENIVLEPESVEIAGPETQLKGLNRVEAFPIDMRQVAEDFSQEVNLRSPGPLTELSVGKVKVEVDVSVVQSTRNFKALAVEVRGTGDRLYSVEPKVVDVAVVGAVNLIKSLTPDQISPYIRPSSSEEQQSLAVQVDAPEAVSLTSVTPERVLVKIVDRAGDRSSSSEAPSEEGKNG